MLKISLQTIFFLILYISALRKLSSVGRASALQAEGHRFEPYSFHHNCGSGSVVERHLAKVNVASSNLVSRSKRVTVYAIAAYYVREWHHSQVVRQSSAKASPPVQIWVVPPKKLLLINARAFLFYIRCCGGIGRHKGLKIPRGRLRTGSSPVSSTKASRLTHTCGGVLQTSEIVTLTNEFVSLDRRCRSLQAGQQHQSKVINLQN